MKIFLLTFLFLSHVYSTTIHVPGDFATIQSGINASSDGDTVLVAEGTYYETLYLDKEITLASNAIMDDLDENWLENMSIHQTIISASEEPINSNYGSCLVIEGGYINPTILGLTFQDGTGTNMKTTACDIDINSRSGGAILLYKAYPTIIYNRFINNGQSFSTGINNTGNSVNDGGAIGLYDDEDVEFDEDRSRPRSTSRLTRIIPDTLNITNNYFEGNSSGNGESFYCHGFEGAINVSGSIFENIDCETSSVNEFVLKSVDDNADYVQLNIVGNCLENNMIYVSSQSGNDSNIGTELQPLKTIKKALSFVKNQADITTTIYVDEGTYSPQGNGEIFPIVLPDNVHLLGGNRETTILDAQANQQKEAAVMIIPECENVKISNFTLRGGYSEGHGCSGGGGLLVTANDMDNEDINDIRANQAIIENLIVEDNHSHNGGGISFWRISGATMNNVISRNNVATFNGGGIFIYCSEMDMTNIESSNNSLLGYNWGFGNFAYGGGLFLAGLIDGTIENAVISNNTALIGGGIFTTGSYNTWTMSNSLISENTASYQGGGIEFVDDASPTLINVTFDANIANDKGGGALSIGTTTPVFENCTITNNSAPNGDGGGAFIFNEWNWSTNQNLEGSYPIFNDCFFEGNTSIDGAAVGYGKPGLWGLPDGATFYRNIVVNNQSSNYCGGININGGSSEIINCTIIDNSNGNTVNGSGGVDVAFSGFARIINSILRGNANFYGAEVLSYSSTVFTSYSNIENIGNSGTENIDEDPLFYNPENLDFRLNPDSPCIDAGSSNMGAFSIEDLTDYEGSAPDIGAVEGGVLPAITGLVLYPQANSVILTWNPITDVEVEYYTIERSLNQDFMNTDSMQIQTINTNYFEDTELIYDVDLFYRVSYHSVIQSEYSDTISVSVEWLNNQNNVSLPIKFKLHQNYPNPFNPKTKINYDIPYKNFVSIIISDIKGFEVKSLVNKYHAPGRFSVVWDGTNNNGDKVAAGMYLYKIKSGNFTSMEKMIFLK